MGGFGLIMVSIRMSTSMRDLETLGCFCFEGLGLGVSVGMSTSMRDFRVFLF